MKKLVLLVSVVMLALIIAGCSTTTRSTQEVVEQHHEKVGTWDVEEIITDYADDAVMVMSTGDILVGEEAIKAGFAGFFTGFPNLIFTESKFLVEGDTVLLMWKGESDTGIIPYAVDSFIIRDDKIQRQTCWLEFIPK